MREMHSYGEARGRFEPRARRLNRSLVSRLSRKFKGCLIIRASDGVKRNVSPAPNYPRETKKAERQEREWGMDRGRGERGEIADDSRPMEII